MPIWITATGVGCIGVVCGYILFYSLKRNHPPATTIPLSMHEVISTLAAVGAGGVLGGAFIALEKINYMGPYGIGLLLGTSVNVFLTLRHERPFMK
jgi:hypothetical protein